MSVHDEDAARPLLDDTDRGSTSLEEPRDVLTPTSSETEPSPNLTLGQLLKIAPGLGLGTLLVQADATLELSSYATIGSEFHQLKHVAWLTIAYVLMTTASQPLYSRLSDYCGRKPVILACYAFFAIGVTLCSLSPSFWLLVAARGVVGLGGAGMGFLVTVILNDIVALRDRALWQSGLVVLSVCGQVVGGPLGGLAVDHLGWRPAFLILLPFGLFTILLVYWTLKLPQLPTQVSFKDHDTGSPLRQIARLNNFDLYGACTLVSSTLCLVVVLNLAGNDVPWNHPIVPSLLVLDILLFALYAHIELKLAAVPLIPLHLLRPQYIYSLFGTNFFSTMTLMGLLYLMPLYVKASGHGSSSLSGLMIVLCAIGQSIGHAVAGLLIKWRGYVWQSLVCANGVYILALIMFRQTWQGSENAANEFLWPIISGICMGVITNCLLINLIRATSQEDRAVMYAGYHLFSNIANMIALSVLAAMVQYRTRYYLGTNLEGSYHGDIEKVLHSPILTARTKCG
ncbi:hypothetical protein PV10_00761 [Exophiala mesophila]|uniref:Major facilitator superfamily (MFS) profile domain-containing protein n=1 Tax=Exophiala mesophila TaxID=212818 RepID=A0A0D1Y8B0_EXOME|nr:uncharacterized protein PV10_00761 [Exophiala mesophila]KIV96951.1 hypothetical protein PV10_00761 [Exophiala mesophila]